MGKKYTIEYVKTVFESKGYTLLSTEYKNNKSPLKYNCPKHGEKEINFSSILSGQGCSQCGHSRAGKSRMCSLDEIRKIVHSHGYILLSTEPVGQRSKIKCRCSKHGDFYITLGNIKTGQGCEKCGRESSSKKRKISIEKVRSIIENSGYKLCQNSYKNNHEKLKCKCKKHGVFFMSLKAISRGEKCRDCAFELRSGSGHHNWKGGITNISEYLRKIVGPWKKSIITDNNYRCEMTGKQGTVNVHHMVSFSSIVDITLKELNISVKGDIGEYTTEELKKIENKFIYNNEKMAQPVVMLESLHKKFHKFCGGNKKPTSFEQLAEFKRLVKEGVISA